MEYVQSREFFVKYLMTPNQEFLQKKSRNPEIFTENIGLGGINGQNPILLPDEERYYFSRYLNMLETDAELIKEIRNYYIRNFFPVNSNMMVRLDGSFRWKSFEDYQRYSNQPEHTWYKHGEPVNYKDYFNYRLCKASPFVANDMVNVIPASGQMAVLIDPDKAAKQALTAREAKSDAMVNYTKLIQSKTSLIDVFLIASFFKHFTTVRDTLKAANDPVLDVFIENSVLVMSQDQLKAGVLEIATRLPLLFNALIDGKAEIIDGEMVNLGTYKVAALLSLFVTAGIARRIGNSYTIEDITIGNSLAEAVSLISSNNETYKGIVDRATARLNNELTLRRNSEFVKDLQLELNTIYGTAKSLSKTVTVTGTTTAPSQDVEVKL